MKIKEKDFKFFYEDFKLTTQIWSNTALRIVFCQNVYRINIITGSSLNLYIWLMKKNGHIEAKIHSENIKIINN